MTFLWIAAALVRWVRLKIYQYEVTFAVYMLTPTEKFIFSMFLLQYCARSIFLQKPARLSPPHPHLHDPDSNLRLPTQPPPSNLRPPILLLGR
jgi:hypothetical protein